jgi:hypothetical protein
MNIVASLARTPKHLVLTLTSLGIKMISQQ